jgi:hypothetical protein
MSAASPGAALVWPTLEMSSNSPAMLKSVVRCASFRETRMVCARLPGTAKDAIRIQARKAPYIHLLCACRTLIGCIKYSPRNILQIIQGNLFAGYDPAAFTRGDLCDALPLLS